MEQPHTVSTTPSQTSETTAKLDGLEQELDKLKKLVEEDHKGLAGWAKRWGAILALFVALFAVPRGVVDAYHVFWSRPNTELVSGSDLVLDYDPATRKVSFAVEFGAANTGTRDDFVRDLKGNLKNDSAPEVKDLPFGIPDIQCSSQGAKIGLPFPVRTTESTSISCTFASELTEPAAGPFAHAGAYRLAMSMSGLDKESQTLDFCFYVDDKMLSDLLGSRKLETARFLYPDCSQVHQQ